MKVLQGKHRTNQKWMWRDLVIRVESTAVHVGVQVIGSGGILAKGVLPAMVIRCSART